MPDLTELQRLAEEATSGPWNANEDGVATTVNGRYRVILSSNMYDTRRAKDSAFVAAMSPDTAKKLIAAAEALELMLDCSSQEWQQADGKRMAATDNQGRRFWFITEDVMQAARTALEELK